MPFSTLGAGTTDGGAGARPLVWILDDSRLEGEQARAALEETCELELFDDGGRLVERLAAGEVPDVLVADWVMPDISGTDVCRYVRESPHGETLPVLILTAYHQPGHVEAAFHAGANDYLQKPYAPAELRARVVALARSKALRGRAERAEAAVRLLLAELPDAVLLVDPACRVVYANDEAERVLGGGPEPIVGQPLGQVVAGLDCDDLERAVGSDLRIGDRVYAPHLRRLEADTGVGAVISLRDVTEARRREARRLDFYSMVAHELRTPLSAMLMRVDWLLAERRGPLAPAVRTDVQKIEARIRDLVGLINDFLELARIESAGVGIAPARFDLNELAREVVEEFQQLAAASRLALELAADPGGAPLVADRRRIRQVLTNLLSNAVKFTPPGGRIRVAVRRGPGRVEARVEDTGRGIPADVLPHIFERYVRGAGGPRGESGTGLGLAIVREIVEAHGGTVAADSVPGSGTTVRIELPPAPDVPLSTEDGDRPAHAPDGPGAALGG